MTISGGAHARPHQGVSYGPDPEAQPIINHSSINKSSGSPFNFGFPTLVIVIETEIYPRIQALVPLSAVLAPHSSPAAAEDATLL